jgi:hypothetical protein
MEKYAGFLTKAEATRYADRIMSMGYIIPEKIKFDNQAFVSDSRTIYTFQSPVLWRSNYKRKPTDEGKHRQETHRIQNLVHFSIDM